MTQQQTSSKREKNADRLLINTYGEVQHIVDEYKANVMEVHPSIVYEEGYWCDLQQDLEQFVKTQQNQFEKHGFESFAGELQYYHLFVIRTAVEELRHRVEETPRAIHSDDVWEQFKQELQPSSIPRKYRQEMQQQV